MVKKMVEQQAKEEIKAKVLAYSYNWLPSVSITCQLRLFLRYDPPVGRYIKVPHSKFAQLLHATLLPNLASKLTQFK